MNQVQAHSKPGRLKFFIEGRIHRAARLFVADHIRLPISERQMRRLDGISEVTLGIRHENVRVSADVLGAGIVGFARMHTAFGSPAAAAAS
jgi:hypothetical protein